MQVDTFIYIIFSFSVIIFSRCREIQPQLRYCEFNCGDDASRDAAMSEMINMRLQLGDEEGALQEDFDVRSRMKIMM